MVEVVKVAQVVRVVRVVRIISQDDIHSGSIWFLWSKPSNYQEKLRCHDRDKRTNGGGGKWKIGQCSELNQKPQHVLGQNLNCTILYFTLWNVFIVHVFCLFVDSI